MKPSTTKLFLLSAVLLFSICCTKQKDQKDEIKIDETNLTSCQTGADCQYVFTEQPGPYRLFSNSVKTPGASSLLYIKAPKQGDTFSLNKADILSGRIELTRSCPACYQTAFKPIDGYVKGINLTPGKEIGQTKWLLEAKILMQAEGDPSVKDSIYIKQYFYPDFILYKQD